MTQSTMEMKPVPEKMEVGSFISEVFLDDKEKILKALEEKNIYSLYDFLSAVTSFKLTNYTKNDDWDNTNSNGEEKSWDKNARVMETNHWNHNDTKNEKNNFIKDKTNPNSLCQDAQCEQKSVNKEITGTQTHASFNSDAHHFSGLANGDVDKGDTLFKVYGTNKLNIENGKIGEIHGKKRCYEKELNNNELKGNKKINIRNDEVCFSTIIHFDLIKTLPINNNDKNKFLKYIQSFIEQNEIYAVCIYLNLRSLFGKLKQFNIKSLECLKQLLEAKTVEWITQNFEISKSEFSFLSGFTERVKKKQVLCNSCENVDNPREDAIFEFKKKNVKIICDKIHQFVEFDKWIFEHIIDNAFFQRLRNLSQLGACQYVYPGATHTRFEHSLGVGFLSAKYFTHFANELNVPFRDREVNRMFSCVQIAGLCHDLGHGPFSHTFESYYVNYKKEKSEYQWNHEDMSLQIVERIIENMLEKSDILDLGDIKTIQKLIYGRPCYQDNCTGLDPIDSFLEASFDIVCNNLNGLDADKFDYLQRDALIAPNNGTLPALNCNRLCDRSTIINSRIVYNKKEIHTVWSVYLNRFSMFKKVYTHDKIRAMELMLCDGFRLSDHIFKWSEALENIDTFLDLTDNSIITDIKRMAKRMKNDEKMNKAVNLINAVVCDRTSDHAYKFIDNFNITEPGLIHHFQEITTENRIARYVVGLNPEDIVIDWNNLHYGMGPKDPFDFVYFYNSNEKDHIFRANAEDRGAYPKYFQEYNVRLYCKNKKVKHLAKEAFRHFKATDVYPVIEASHKNSNVF